MGDWLAQLLVPERAWALHAEGRVLLPYVRFLADGRLGGSARDSLRRWSLEPDVLRLFDNRGAPSACFPVDRAAFDGRGGLPGHAADHGALTLMPRQDADGEVLPSEGMRVAGSRRHLVVLRAGANSLHPFWEADLAEAERNWDLCHSVYGDTVPAGPAEYVIRHDGSKFQGLSQLLRTHRFAYDYDYVWFPDDDLMTSWSDVNRLFALCREYDLMLAQPALSVGSFLNHKITEVKPTFLLRYSSFVEIMAPLFSKAALRLCAPTFADNVSGYGLDHLWPRLLGAPSHRVAIVDAVAVTHTRPQGASYDIADATREGRQIEARYGQLCRYQIYGGILGVPTGYVRRIDPATGCTTIHEGAEAETLCR